ncbi:hypothetical protein AB0J43_02060 [Nonomuraea fuscirosea]
MKDHQLLVCIMGVRALDNRTHRRPALSFAQLSECLSDIPHQVVDAIDFVLELDMSPIVDEGLPGALGDVDRAVEAAAVAGKLSGDQIARAEAGHDRTKHALLQA